MIINRVWAMPSRWTFTIKPIAELLARYVGDGKGWIDPFAGMTSPAEFTNDLNPDMPTGWHLPADKFCALMNDRQFKGILFDPPYSLGQVKQCYESYGLVFSQAEAQMYNAKLKRHLARLIEQGGCAICCGWNSLGLGKTKGFRIVEILLVPHGRDHNDTIVTVETKVQGGLL